MARQEFDTSPEKARRLSAQEVHHLTQETLQAHFQLGREGCASGPEHILDVLQRLLIRVKQREVRVRRLFLDREFDNNAVIGYLTEQPFPTMIALTIRGKQGGIRNHMITVY